MARGTELTISVHTPLQVPWIDLETVISTHLIAANTASAFCWWSSTLEPVSEGYCGGVRRSKGMPVRGSPSKQIKKVGEPSLICTLADSGAGCLLLRVVSNGFSRLAITSAD